MQGGVRFNIIPEQVVMEGTVRTYDEAMRDDIHRRMTRTAAGIAEASGAKAETVVTKVYPVTSNDLSLTARMAPTLKRVGGPGGWTDNVQKATGSEDFSEFGKVAPSLFLFIGVTPPAEVATAPANHSPKFTVDEAGLKQGARALAHLTLDYMNGAAAN
jgi:amidohydrolase